MVKTMLKTVSYIIILVKNGPKGSETVQNYRKGVKIFKNFEFFSINSKKFKTLYIILNFYPIELRTSNANSRSFVGRNPTPFFPGKLPCPALPFACKFFEFPWSKSISRLV